MTEETKTKDTSNGGCGCFSFIVFMIFMWALLFGVTYDGKHYGMSCSCDRGVAIDHN